jgi:trimeric autotransporter adhesin
MCFYTAYGDIIFGASLKYYVGPDMIIKSSSSPNNPIGMGVTEPSQKLHVNGNILATGTVSQSSDERLKKDIKVVDGALAKISQIKGVTYKWKKPENHGDDKGRQLGVIAQDVEKVFPEAVKEDKEGIKSVNYGDMIAPLIEAVKELKAENDALRAEIIEIKKKI